MPRATRIREAALIAAAAPSRACLMAGPLAFFLYFRDFLLIRVYHGQDRRGVVRPAVGRFVTFASCVVGPYTTLIRAGRPGRDPLPGRSRTPMTVRIRALTEKTLCAPEERNAPLITTPVIRSARRKHEGVSHRLGGRPPKPEKSGFDSCRPCRARLGRPRTAGPTRADGLWCNGSTLPLQGRDQGSTPCGSTRPEDHGRGAPRTGRGAGRPCPPRAPPPCARRPPPLARPLRPRRARPR